MAHDLVSEGGRVGGFVIFRDDEGLRHAIRIGAIQALSDIADADGATLIQVAGKGGAIIRTSLEEVLSWLR